MKKVLFIILLLYLIPLSIFGENDFDEEYFIRFKYNNEEFSASEKPTENPSKHIAWFLERNHSDIIIACEDIGINSIFAIIISERILENETYIIYNSSLEKIIPDIWVRFGKDSSIKHHETTKEVIGEITITEKTANRLSGIFKCKLYAGAITDGAFSVKRIYSKE